MQVTATEAKNRFGHICAQAKTAPVIVSWADYQALTGGSRAKTLAQRRREFNATCKDWLAEQHRDFEQHGPWSHGLVAPLSRVGATQARLPPTLCPVVEWEGETLSFMPHLAAAID